MRAATRSSFENWRAVQKAALVAIIRNPAVTPALRAFVLSYATVVGPRILNITLLAIRRRHHLRKYLSGLKHVLLSALALNGLPIFWAALLVSSISFSRVTDIVVSKLSTSRRDRQASTFIAAMIAGGYTLRWHQRLLRRDATNDITLSIEEPVKNRHEHGRTIDNTLFTVISAVDYLFRRALVAAKHKSLLGMSKIDYRTTDIYAFVVSATVIMYAWFYHPTRLPKSYNHWITKFADMDTNLLTALRLVKSGDFVYGKDTGCKLARTCLTPSCEKLGLPKEYGDPAVTVPIPCVIIHANKTENCEVHAAWRFSRAFTSALAIYIPLNMVLLLRARPGRRLQHMAEALFSACRSASFLGMFVALAWYSVCFTRTRAGPYLFPKVKRLRWDDTLGPALGSFMCGWSVLLENPRRRGELALFVAPRAIGAFLPEDFDKFHEYAECAVFSVAYAVLFSAATNAPKAWPAGLPNKGVRLRGVVGNALMAVLGKA
ncbi:hypothetical protein V1517DRAFT_322107 [Lipomyces orientalis]|uniref:Uncharacterized protein n=1 Tax=Lipomyces orientalis TaxID=1233043 RepID=A0ACC3TQE6_9ASCO